MFSDCRLYSLELKQLPKNFHECPLLDSENMSVQHPENVKGEFSEACHCANDLNNQLL